MSYFVSSVTQNLNSIDRSPSSSKRHQQQQQQQQWQQVSVTRIERTIEPAGGMVRCNVRRVNDGVEEGEPRVRCERDGDGQLARSPEWLMTTWTCSQLARASNSLASRLYYRAGTTAHGCIVVTLLRIKCVFYLIMRHSSVHRRRKLLAGPKMTMGHTF